MAQHQAVCKEFKEPAFLNQLSTATVMLNNEQTHFKGMNEKHELPAALDWAGWAAGLTPHAAYWAGFCPRLR